MSKRNVTISSMLDSNTDEQTRNSSPGGASGMPILNLVQQFQTSITDSFSQGPGPDQYNSVEVEEAADHNYNRVPIAIRPSPGLPLLVPKTRAISVSPGPEPASKTPSFVVSDHIKRFQTSFQLTPTPQPGPAGPAGPTGPTTPTARSKTSINSIINIDDEPEVINIEATPPPPAVAPKKRKPAQKKKEDPAKKRKPDEPIVVEDKKTPKPAPKQTTKTKKKPLETPKPVYPAKPAIYPGMTTEKAAKAPDVKLPPPSVIEIPTEKDDEKQEPPIIALNIPLIDPANPKPGQSEVVINVLRLSEEKYGWQVIHPKARSAIDIMDDMIEDDDDGADEDDDEEVIVVEEKAEKEPKKKEELTEEQLVRRHEVKMNRKVGKYDYEDPFIDDVELQMEEEITSTKEGFFVYWGPLVDDRTMNGGPKKTSKTKK